MKQAMGCFYVYWSVLSRLVEKPKEGKYFDYLNNENKDNFFFCVKQFKYYEYFAPFYLNHGYLVRSNLNDIQLIGSHLDHSNLRNANFNRAVLSNSELRFVCLASAKLRNADLFGCDLSNSDLYHTNLYQTVLFGSVLENTNMEYALLVNANLSNANFNGAYLRDANLYQANVTNSSYLTYEQLAQTKTLYGCTGIPEDIEQKLRETHPHLFEAPKEKE
ncbi:MAG: pentapeptide repeat-containing protein [Bacteroidota bacterium]